MVSGSGPGTTSARDLVRGEHDLAHVFARLEVDVRRVGPVDLETIPICTDSPNLPASTSDSAIVTGLFEGGAL